MDKEPVEFVEFKEQEFFSEQDLRFMESLTDLIAKLVNKRVSMQMTQKELANKIGISNVSMCRIETRAKTPSLETLFRMAESLGMVVSVADKSRKEVAYEQ